MTTRNVVFWDFGGVVTTSPFERFAEIEKELGLPNDFIRTINSVNPDTNAWARLERSEISREEFDTEFAKEAYAKGHKLSGALVLTALKGEVRPEMAKVIRHLNESGIKQACLTNNIAVDEDSDEIAGQVSGATSDSKVAEVMGLFDHIIESSEVGVRKPDPSFYKLALDTVGVAPQQVVFLDDLGINLKPAKAMGMHTIKVIDSSSALAELAKALQMQLP